MAGYRFPSSGLVVLDGADPDQRPRVRSLGHRAVRLLKSFARWRVRDDYDAMAQFDAVVFRSREGRAASPAVASEIASAVLPDSVAGDSDQLAKEFDRFLRTLLASRRTYRFALGRERVG